MSKKKIQKSDGDLGVDLIDRESSKDKVEPPKKYKAIYYNNDHTPMQLVTISLMQIWGHDEPQAQRIMISIHEKGREIVKSGLTKEIAEMKVMKTIQFFNAFGFPLECNAEPE
jgi:ATP-dependent Clp protease adaptor protein ClpS